MNEQAPSYLRRSVHPVGRWIQTIDETRETPDGLPLHEVTVRVGSAEEQVEYLFTVDPCVAGVVVAGNDPEFLGESADPTKGWFRLTAPCVVMRWHRQPGGTLICSVLMAVHRLPEPPRPAKMPQPNPELMRAIGTLVHLSKREQKRRGRLPRLNPTEPDAEGRDPDGDR